MSRLRRAVLGRPNSDEGGQALAVVVALVSVLVLVPTAVQVLSSGQLPISQASQFDQQALEGARAGISDYVNWLRTQSDYPLHCSSGVPANLWVCPSGHTRDSANPAFASSAGDDNWVLTQGTSGSFNLAYQYLVDTSNVGAGISGPTDFTVYSTGRAGSPNHYTYQTIEATLQYTPSSSSTYTLSTVSSSCSSNSEEFVVPPGMSYAKIVAYGAEGGGGGNTQGGGGVGAAETAYLKVTPGEVLTLAPGVAGYSGDYSLLNLFGQGGAGGCGELSGGDGGGYTVGVSVQVGAGGGGATTVCYGNPSSSQCGTSGSLSLCSATPTAPCLLVVAGGGGGDGGDSAALASGGDGAYWQSGANWETTGQSGSTILGLGAASGGVEGGSSSSAGQSGYSGTFGIGVAIGTGGGGGGGYPDGGGGGQAGGILGVLAGSGAGGGVAQSDAVAAPSGCTDSTTNASDYTSSVGNGQLSITTYTGSSCSGVSPLTNTVAVLDLAQIDPSSSLE